MQKNKPATENPERLRRNQDERDLHHEEHEDREDSWKKIFNKVSELRVLCVFVVKLRPENLPEPRKLSSIVARSTQRSWRGDRRSP